MISDGEGLEQDNYEAYFDVWSVFIQLFRKLMKKD
jgi:hypothetical protein